MISFDFAYYRPDTAPEAFTLFNSLADDGKNPVYYAGGTEIISRARIHQIEFQAVIDVKSIPECAILTKQGNQTIIGAAVPLNQICESNLFPLLATVAKRTADHTARNRITLGGNICSSLPYKEAVMPLLVCDALVVVAGSNGTTTVPLSQIFNRQIALQKGEFLVQFLIDAVYADLPYQSIKKTRQGSPLEYPLVSVAAIKKDGYIRFSLSGVCPFPFRSPQVENDLNNTALPVEARIHDALSHLPASMLHDIQGCAEYRQFILANSLRNILVSLEGVS